MLHRAIGLVELAHLMEREAGPPASIAAAYGYVDQLARRLDQAPKRRGAVMTEDGAGPTGKYGSDPPPEGGRRGVTDEVDARVNPMEPPGADALSDPPVSEAEGEKLFAGDHSVLSRRGRRDRCISWSTFRTYAVRYVARAVHAGQDGNRTRAERKQT